MMRCLCIAAAFLAPFVLASPTVAAPKAAPGTTTKQAPVREARQVMADFARCTVKRHRAEAVEFVLNPALSAWDRRMRKLADDYCLTPTAELKDAEVALRVPGNIMRFAIADALVGAELPTFDPQVIERAQPLPPETIDRRDFEPKPGSKYQPTASEIEATMAKARVRIAFWQFGECVVRAAPANAHYLLMTKPSSPAEGGAFQTLMPTFGQCLPQGATLDSNRAMLRGVIALTYYRLAHAPQVVPGASK